MIAIIGVLWRASGAAIRATWPAVRLGATGHRVRGEHGEGNGMVLGITRERTTLARRAAQERTGPVYGWDDWLIERGAVQWDAQADLTGGFPGFAAHGGCLDGCQVRVTERFLLVDEGRRHGFGLPLAWLVDADVLPSLFRGDRGETVLRVRYNDRDRVRTFLVRFRGPFLAMRGGRRAEQALAALRSVGLEEGAEPLPPLPEIAHTWLEAARFEQENVIWSGVASAALGPGQEPEPCDVWLTTRSVIWGGGTGEGVLRLALDRVLDVIPAELESRGRTPAVYLACADEAGGRHDLPFIFDRQHPAQRCHRERGALLVGLRSRGIPLGVMPLPPQPWQTALAQVAVDDDVALDQPQPLDLPFQDGVNVPRFRTAAPGRRRTQRRLAAVGAPTGETDNPAAWSLGPDLAIRLGLADVGAGDDIDHSVVAVRQPGTFGRGALTLLPWRIEAGVPPTPVSSLTGSPVPASDLSRDDNESGTSAIVALAFGDVAEIAAAEPLPLPVEPAPASVVRGPLAVVDAYEDAVVAVLVEAAQGIERCLGGNAWSAPVMPVPSSADQVAAHVALDELLTQGSLTGDEVRTRRCRLVAAGEAGPRLRTLLELREAKLLSDADLTRKRAEIMGPLAEVLQRERG